MRTQLRMRQAQRCLHCRRRHRRRRGCASDPWTPFVWHDWTALLPLQHALSDPLLLLLWQQHWLVKVECCQHARVCTWLETNLLKPLLRQIKGALRLHRKRQVLEIRESISVESSLGTREEKATSETLQTLQVAGSVAALATPVDQKKVPAAAPFETCETHRCVRQAHFHKEIFCRMCTCILRRQHFRLCCTAAILGLLHPPLLKLVAFLQKTMRMHDLHAAAAETQQQEAKRRRRRRRRMHLQKESAYSVSTSAPGLVLRADWQQQQQQQQSRGWGRVATSQESSPPPLHLLARCCTVCACCAR